MTCYRKFDHLERLGHTEVAGILDGRVWVLPKLDGTNAAVWLGDDLTVRAGSRNREISVESDNHGFAKWLHSDCPRAEAVRRMALSNPGLIFYGEWLVKHSFKDYEEDAWRRFWIFDAYDATLGAYLGVPAAESILSESLVDFVPHQALLNRPSAELVAEELDRCSFLVKDDKPGEGIVLKRDGWRNRFGRQTWAKVVREEFSNRPAKVRGASDTSVEEAIAADVTTASLVRKELAKVVAEIASRIGGAHDEIFHENKGRIIPEVLGRVWHCVVNEEMWDLIKRYNNPTLNFRELKRSVEAKTRAALLGG